jgi:mannose/fructose/N-acetylgalactosamine-specific phosphotransferase system component IIB
MGANDKLYNDSMSKESEKEAAAPNTKISRFKIEGVMPLVETQKARYWY